MERERPESYPGGEEEPKLLFTTEWVVGTPGALQAIEEAELHPLDLLMRHMTGDWGELADEDKQENELALERELRILSAYRLETGVKVWLITEADRSVTTFLLPSEY